MRLFTHSLFPSIIPPARGVRRVFHLQEQNMDLLEKLNWRYATKKMDPSKRVPQETVERILEAVRLTPTSSGLQPFEVIVITNPELREQIKPIANGQAQVAECSHLLVFAAWDDYTPERINKMFDLVAAARGGTNEGWENYRKNLLASYPPRGPEVNFNHIARQAYIGLGVAIAAAAVEGVDCTPMEGYNAAALDELLNLRARGLRSVLLLPLGYREEAKDWLAKLKKARRPREDFIIEMK
jgi:nitroreductase/dihydropteridine reductase